MSVLCFGSFASILKETTPYTREGVVDVLVDAINSSASSSLHYSDKNKLINSKLEVPLYIADNAGTPTVTDSIEQYFIKKIIPKIRTTQINELINNLVEVVNGDASICDTDKAQFFTMANAAQLALFLSSIYHFAVPRPNKHKRNPLPVVISKNEIIRLQNGRIYLDGEEIALPDKLTPPADFSDNTMPYIIELLRAYAQADCVPVFGTDTIPSKYQNNFERQRQDYFNAEAVSRRVREVSTNAVEQFDLFKQDTFDGIIDICEQSHANGFERLLKVLQQAASRPQGKSILEQLPNWIGSSEKKGACHILVNEKRISWVVE